MKAFTRTELLLGTENMRRISDARVAVFGIGGVGSSAAEALARSGIGSLDLCDHDQISLTNINRQIIALRSTIGQAKVKVMRDRIHDINPAAEVTIWKIRFDGENMEEFPFETYDYIIDAVDSVTSKLLLAEKADSLGIPLISSMGVGNKIHPEQLEISDLYNTSICPLAKVMRREIKKRGISHLKVLYSKEQPIRTAAGENGQRTNEGGKLVGGEYRPVPGSISFVPPAAGLIIAAEVIRDLINL